MSNHLALATVTAALGQLVHASASAVVSGASLQFGRPIAPSSGVLERKVFVYLFQVTPNAALRNADLPSRDSSGQLRQRPTIALDLHYLVTFSGDDALLEPQRMLGAVARDLHAQPVLTTAAIQNAIASNSELASSDLASAIERVKFTPASLGLEETSKLWSVLLQTPHMLSVLYQASLVLIEAVETPSAALPVLQRGPGDRGVDAQLGSFPHLDRFWAGAEAARVRRPRMPSLPNAEPGATLVLEGEHLRGDAVALAFAHPRLPPRELPGAPGASERELIVTLLPDPTSDADWAPGIYTVTARVTRGDAQHTSNALPLPLAPRVTSIAPDSPVARAGNGSVTLTITCRPNVLPSQTATLLLAQREIAAEPLMAASGTLTFVVESAPVVTDALCRIRVDGVESLPFRFDDTTGSFVFDDAQRITII